MSKVVENRMQPNTHLAGTTKYYSQMISRKSKISIENLRARCNRIHYKRKLDVKTIIETWLNNSFLLKNKPWRAIMGSKKYIPISLKNDIEFQKISHNISSSNFWPDIQEKEIIVILKNLGFLLNDDFTIAVPAYNNCKNLSFAQAWAKKINDNYSRYIQKEKALAKKDYQEIIFRLYEIPSQQIKIYDEYILFEDAEISGLHYSNSLTKLLTKNGFEFSPEGIRLYNN